LKVYTTLGLDSKRHYIFSTLLKIAVDLLLISTMLTNLERLFLIAKLIISNQRNELDTNIIK
jgi:hypothetical protein